MPWAVPGLPPRRLRPLARAGGAPGDSGRRSSGTPRAAAATANARYQCQQRTAQASCVVRASPVEREPDSQASTSRLKRIPKSTQPARDSGGRRTQVRPRTPKATEAATAWSAITRTRLRSLWRPQTRSKTARPIPKTANVGRMSVARPRPSPSTADQRAPPRRHAGETHRGMRPAEGALQRHPAGLRTSRWR